MKAETAIAIAFLTIACGRTPDPDGRFVLECKGILKLDGVENAPAPTAATRTYLIEPKTNQVSSIGDNRSPIFCRDTCRVLITSQAIGVSGSTGSNSRMETSIVIDRVSGGIVEQTGTSAPNGGKQISAQFTRTCHPIDIPDNLKAKF
jgi:hypothetical protein